VRDWVGRIIFLAVGVLGALAFTVLFGDKTVLETLKDINDKYAAVVGALLTAVLVLVTLVYVILTYFQVKASHQSLAVSQRLLRQAEDQLRLSKVPILVAEVTNTHGTAYFGRHRRQLGIDWKVKNIGDSPALQAYARMALKYKYVEFQYVDQLFEYFFLGSVGLKKRRSLTCILRQRRSK
jgi:hypothetical protein